MGKRINKYLSEAGYCSRREADKLLEERRIMINGMIAEIGQKVLEGDEVYVDGKKVLLKQKLVYLALNKPIGVTSTTDLKDPTNIVDFMNYPLRIFHVGRLDKDSEGLILMTNDGDIVNKILRSENRHEKEYVVKVNKNITTNFIEGMASGVEILGTKTKPCKVNKIDETTFNIILTEGLNRQIRRMCSTFGYKVLSLRRTRIMNIELGTLNVGEWRYLTNAEIDKLKNLVKYSSKTEEASR
jgi:23S rRNA pseudouridine2604 synthase